MNEIYRTITAPHIYPTEFCLLLLLLLPLMLLVPCPLVPELNINGDVVCERSESPVGDRCAAVQVDVS